MNEATLNYVRQHADDDVRMLALRGSKDDGVDLTAALEQIAGRQTARRKLPTWAEHDDILYPPHLNMEQCSSEQTARYKAVVCQRLLSTLHSSCAHLQSKNPQPSSPSTLIDLTGGFGVDFSFMAPLFDEASYVEQQEHLCQLARHNFKALGLSHCQVVCANSADILLRIGHASVIFLDPARRDQHGARTYGIADCSPNVLEMRDELLKKAVFIVLKLSPMLDWRKAVSDLGRAWTREVHIISVGGECKELLIVLSANELTKDNDVCSSTETADSDCLRVFCVNDDTVFEYDDGAENGISVTSFADPAAGACLYEPNASLMKAGCFEEIARRLCVQPIANNSHLFVSSHFIDDFPGRKFRIQAVSSMNKQELKRIVSPLGSANIAVRNFPLMAVELRKRLKLSEGGSNYLFATTLADGTHVLLVCQRFYA